MGSLISRCSAPRWKRLCRGRTGPVVEAALRSRADVQGPDPSGDEFSVRRASGVADQGPAVRHARFFWIGLSDNVLDANTIWTFREALKKACAVDDLFRRFDEALRRGGFLAMSGQIVDATIVPPPPPSSATQSARRMRSATSASLTNGRTSPPRSRRRIGTPAGRSNTPRRSPAGTAASRRSISPFPPSATRTTCRSTMGLSCGRSAL